MPPDADTVTVEEPPLQAIAVAEAEAVRAEGCVMATEVVAVQPLLSVTV